MRILIVAPDVDLTTVKGDAIHLQNLLENWTESHEIHLVSGTPRNQIPHNIVEHVSITSGITGKAGSIIQSAKAIAAVVEACLSHDFDLVYERHGVINSGTLAKILTTTQYVIEVNGVPSCEHTLKGNHASPALQMLQWAERLSLALPDQVICVSPRIRTELSERFNVANDKLSVVQNGVDTDLFRVRSDAKSTLGWDDSRQYVGFVGSLKPWHGIEQLLASWSQLSISNARLVIIGDGPLREQLEQIAIAEGIADTVIFTGEIPHDNVPMYLNALDAGVVLKHPQIPQSPLKMFEYLACGTPVVVTDDADLQIVSNRNVGTSVEYDDCTSIAQGIAEVLSYDADKVEERARDVAEERSWSNVAQQVLDEIRNSTRGGT